MNGKPPSVVDEFLASRKQPSVVDEFLAQKQKPVSGWGTQLVRSTGESLIDNALGIPEFIARAGQGAMNVGRAAMGQEMIGRPRGTNILPNLGVDVNGRKALSMLDMLLEGGSYDENLALQEAGAAENPIADTVGDALGTALPMFRMKRWAVESEPATALKAWVQQRGEAIARVAATERTDGAMEFAKVAAAKLAASKGDQVVLRALGRAAETGIEGAVISMMEDSDPTEAAAFYAGTQMAGDAIAGTLKSAISRDLTKTAANLGVLAFSAGSLVQLLKSGAPGGDDYILPSIESGFYKVAGALALSGAFHFVGGGRVQSDFLKNNAPILTDAWGSLRRGSVMSVIEEWKAADMAERNQIEWALQRVGANPDTAPKVVRDALDAGTSLLDAMRDGGEQVSEWIAAPPSVAAVPRKPTKRRNRGIGFQ